MMTRIGIVAIAVCGLAGGIATSAYGQDGDEESEGAVAQAPAGLAEDVAPTLPAKWRAPRRTRRAKVKGFAVRDADLRQTPLPPPSGRIVMHTIASDEDVAVDIYNDDGSYNSDALKELDHGLRCKRTESEKSIDPRLYVLLSHVYDHFQKPLQLVSGYRNQRRETSFHFKGSASDIRIEGVNPKKIREFASTLDTGGMGIGWYPRAQFVHIDVRPLPSYRWIDNARPNPGAPDKQPPRGWKRRKLQS